MYYDLMEADKIYAEMLKENPDFAKKLVKEWRDKMPENYAKTMYVEKWGCHITSPEMYEKGLSYITDNKKEKISFWTIEEVKKIARDYINIDDQDFYDHDLALQSNIKKGDYGSFMTDASKIIRAAIADLTDEDYPWGDPSERAYKWVEAHIKEEQEEIDKKIN